MMWVDNGLARGTDGLESTTAVLLEVLELCVCGVCVSVCVYVVCMYVCAHGRVRSVYLLFNSPSLFPSFHPISPYPYSTFFHPYTSPFLQLTNLTEIHDQISGMARCPYNPLHNSTALITSSGELYAATAMDFSGRDPAIYRSLGGLPPLRTAQYNSKWLNGGRGLGVGEGQGSTGVMGVLGEDKVLVCVKLCIWSVYVTVVIS